MKTLKELRKEHKDALAISSELEKKGFMEMKLVVEKHIEDLEQDIAQIVEERMFNCPCCDGLGCDCCLG